MLRGHSKGAGILLSPCCPTKVGSQTIALPFDGKDLSMKRFSARRSAGWRLPLSVRRVFVAALSLTLCLSLSVPSVALPGQGQGSSLHAAGVALAAEGDSGDTPGGSESPDPAQANVPYVVELTVADARAALQSAGFAVVVEGDTSDSAKVTHQSHYPTATAGSTITITAQVPAAPTIYQVCLGYVDPATGKYVNRPDADAIPRIVEKGGKMQMLATVVWSTGSEGYAGDQSVTVSWSVSDPSVATIDSRGMLTALKDGTVTVSCTTQTYGTVTGTIQIDVKGQDGAYVTEVLVTRDDGSFYGDDTILFQKFDGTTSVSLYVTVVYSDGTQKCTWKDDKIANLSWSSSDVDSVYVGEQTGTVKPKRDGSAFVTASVSGGLDGVVQGSVAVMVDTGEYEDGYLPSDSLTITVVYESDESVVAKEKTYDVSSLSALGLNMQAYTQVTSNGSYQTLSAQGVYLSTVMDDLGLKTGEISHFYFSALDGINKAMLSAHYLFDRTGYYYPNADNGWTNGQQAAAPMLAVVSKAVRNVPSADFSDLGIGSRFRLCLGSSSFTDSSAQKSFKYLSHIWVVMEGAPRQGGDGGDTPGGDDGKGTGTGTGTGDGQGEGGGSGLSSGLGSTTGLGSSEGSGIGDASGSDTSTSGSTGDDGDANGLSASAKSDADETDAEPSSRWQVFEMMSNAQSDIDPIDFSNPLEPFVLPGVAAVAAVGGGFTLRRYRKELAV